MRRVLPVLAFLVLAGSVRAHGLLIPEEKNVPPLAMLNHKVTINIVDQVATTKVEQTFRNHTPRPLEATYVFPVPKGAAVDKFTMWVDGKEVKGELVKADDARQIYTSIVRRTQDPGLLEYIGTNLLQVKVFPVPANGDQKLSLSYTSVADREKGLVEYVYPLKTDGKATATLEDFAIAATIKSEHGVQNVYSPTHSITLKRNGDKEVAVSFDRKQGLLDKDFQLFYQLGDKDVGLTALTHRPIAAENGYFLMLITPKVEIAKQYQVPRDMVLVMDTSGSMRGPKMEQARKALKYCLDNLDKGDRFALINFSTTVNKYRDDLVEVAADRVAHAKKWVDELDATGGTAINDALATALEMRPKQDDGRTFTVVFFTDGQPTIGETNPDTILKNTLAKNTSNTRIFTFGVGDDVNATMLDQIAEKTRALSTYVRPVEDIEAKVSGLYAKVSHPVLANLKLATTGDVRLSEVYPPQLPDLFHGQQLTVLGRYTGKGASAVKLTGQVGKEQKEFVYELTYPDRTGDEKEFVEQLWARRKVGYLLDQIRANGDKKELVEEVVSLAKKYGITTPYTSYLIVPDGVTPVVTKPVKPVKPVGGGGKPNVGFGGGVPVGGAGFSGTPPGSISGGFPTGGSGFTGVGGGIGGFGGGGWAPGAAAPALRPADPKAKNNTVENFARFANAEPGQLGQSRMQWTDDNLKKLGRDLDKAPDVVQQAAGRYSAYNLARNHLDNRQNAEVQTGKLGVDLSLETANLRNQCRLELTAQRRCGNRNVMEVGGVWIDEGFNAKTRAVVVKAQSNAYFRILEKHPEVKEVFRLGNHLVWVTPSGTALVVDTTEGKDELQDKEIDTLFAAAK